MRNRADQHSIVFLPQIIGTGSRSKSTCTGTKYNKPMNNDTRRIVLKGGEGPLLPINNKQNNNKNKNKNTINHRDDAPQKHNGIIRSTTGGDVISRAGAGGATNIMFDSRVCRGNTFSKLVTVTEDQERRVDIHKRIKNKSSGRSLSQKRTKGKVRRRRNMTPPPVQGRVHVSLQTECSIEELCLLLTNSNDACHDSSTTSTNVGTFKNDHNNDNNNDHNNNNINNINYIKDITCTQIQENEEKEPQNKMVDKQIEHFAEMIVTNAKTQAIEQCHTESLLLFDDQFCYHSEDESIRTRTKIDVHPSHAAMSASFAKKDEDEIGQLDEGQNVGEGKMKHEIGKFAHLVMLEATQNVMKNNIHSIA